MFSIVQAKDSVSIILLIYPRGNGLTEIERWF